MTQPTEGQVYRASDGRWYRWPNPQPFDTEDAAQGIYQPPPPAFEPPPTPAPEPVWSPAPTTVLPSTPVTAIRDSGDPWWKSKWALACTALLVGIGIGMSAAPKDEQPAAQTLVQTEPTESVPSAAAPVATTAAALVPTKAAPPPAQSAGKVRDKSFQVESFQISKDFIDDFEGVARVTNISAKQRSASFTFTIFKGGNLIATIDGYVSEVAPGRTVTVELSTNDDYQPGPYTWEFQVNSEF